jgi:hypothetical protein
MAVVITNASEERIASIIRVTRIGQLTKLAVFFRSMVRLLVTANVVSSSPILVTLRIEVIRSYETSVLTRATRHHIREEGSLRQNSVLPSATTPILSLHVGEYEEFSLLGYKNSVRTS